MNIKFLKDGVSIEKAEIKADQSTTLTLVVSNDSGAAVAGQEIKFETNGLVYLSAMKGVFDANGKFTVVVGPSFGARGDIQITARWKGKKDLVDVKFV